MKTPLALVVVLMDEDEKEGWYVYNQGTAYFSEDRIRVDFDTQWRLAWTKDTLSTWKNLVIGWTWAQRLIRVLDFKLNSFILTNVKGVKRRYK